MNDHFSFFTIEIIDTRNEQPICLFLIHQDSSDEKEKEEISTKHPTAYYSEMK